MVRQPTDEEQRIQEDGQRSADAPLLRRSQIILVSARGERVPGITRCVRCVGGGCIFPGLWPLRAVSSLTRHGPCTCRPAPASGSNGREQAHEGRGPEQVGTRIR
jgi:hypothetical protein